jgi:hypothetical protein
MESNVVSLPESNQAVGGKVNHPVHYNKTSIECIVFARHLGFSAGNAFKYLWRMGIKDDEIIEHGKVEWYVKDVLIHQCASMLSVEIADHLIRMLASIADEFDPETLSLLIALVDSASGDFEILYEIARERGYLSELTVRVMTGQ